MKKIKKKTILIIGLITAAILSSGTFYYISEQRKSENLISMPLCPGMSIYEIEKHNRKFYLYDGEQKGIIIKELINKVIESNKNGDTEPIVSINRIKDEDELIEYRGNISNEKSYNVFLMFKAGYITEITIEG